MPEGGLPPLRAAMRHAKRTAIAVAQVAHEIGGALWHLTIIADPTADIERVGTTATRVADRGKHDSMMRPTASLQIGRGK